MTPRTATWISRALVVLALCMIAVTVVASRAISTERLTRPIVVGSLPIPTSCQDRATTATARDTQTAWCTIQEQIAEGTLNRLDVVSVVNLISFVLAVAWMITGSLIVSRQPRNLGGWVFIAIGLAWVTEGFGLVLTSWALVEGHRLPVPGLFAMLGDTPLVFALLVPLLFLLYPDGRAPDRWRWLPWVFAVAIGALVLGYSLAPGPLNNFVDAGILYANPIGVAAFGPIYSPLSTAGGLAMVLASLATVLAVRSRYKVATGETRQQLRWLVAVATLTGILLLIGIILTILPTSSLSGSGQAPPVFPVVLVAMVLSITIGVPTAYLIAIFRHGLWDLDIVIKKAVLYAVVAGLVLATFAIVAFVLGRLFTRSDKELAVAAAIAGVLVWPAIRVARRAADRIVYRGRATPYEALASFGQRMSETYSTDDVLDRTAQLLASATGATRAVVWLRIGRELRSEAVAPGTAALPAPVAANGDGLPPLGMDAAEPVRDQGELLGALAVDMPANDPLDPGRARILTDLAAQAGLALRNVRLIEELRASRQRLVAAQDEERRKLERNIHDGVQQQLVALAVKLKLTDTMVERDPVKARETLAALQADAGSALEDLRDLARGIYPPLLADKGLVAALEAQARKAAVPTTVTADAVERYEQAIESTVYFCTLEALNNIAKYARASRADISLNQVDGHLSFVITDDGDGFDPSATSYGTGMQGMADRLEAIGGALAVESRPGHGTTVTGTVPVGAA